MSEELNFSLERKEVPVTLNGEKYRLVELTGKQRDVFLNDMGKRMNFIGGKAAGIKNFDGLQSTLICLCLQDAEGKSVDEKVIQEWPASVQGKLFKAAQKLNALDDETSAEIKNG